MTPRLALLLATAVTTALESEVRDHEPHQALFGPDHHTSRHPVRTMLHDWPQIDIIPDLAGVARVICARIEK